MKICKKYWHYGLASVIFLIEAIVLFALGDKIYVGVCDNLDLFIVQLKMLHDGGSFFASDAAMPMLSGIDRDYFPSEWSLYNLLYAVFPAVYAYILGYLCKLLVAFFSSLWLGKLVLAEQFQKYEKPLVLVAIAFALLPLYPMYAICFASLPLVVGILIKIDRTHGIRWYLALFAYPFVSYFSFFGAFIVGYLVVNNIILWIRRRKCPWALWIAVPVLMLGYVCFEYRLFYIMLFSDVITIRETMVIGELTSAEKWEYFIDSFLHGIPHAKSCHTLLALPVCGLYFVIHNAVLLSQKKAKQIWKDPFNLTLAFIVFNSAVYALYYWEPMRDLFETLLPPLKGFQFNRTIFFNTLAWYVAFFLVCKACYDRMPKVTILAGLLAICVVFTTQSEYSDFYNTVYCNLYQLVKGKTPNQLSFGEFYGEELFTKVKDEIGYQDEGAVAYGFHPAVLEYNGITTIDGYCGYYSQEYKEAFREVIAPTLDASAMWQWYYDNWACRAYLFSPDSVNHYDFGADVVEEPLELWIEADALRGLACEYIFSRVEIENADELEITLQGVYAVDSLPYQVYVYHL